MPIKGRPKSMLRESQLANFVPQLKAMGRYAQRSSGVVRSDSRRLPVFRRYHPGLCCVGVLIVSIIPHNMELFWRCFVLMLPSPGIHGTLFRERWSWKTLSQVPCRVVPYLSFFLGGITLVSWEALINMVLPLQSKLTIASCCEGLHHCFVSCRCPRYVDFACQLASQPTHK